MNNQGSILLAVLLLGVTASCSNSNLTAMDPPTEGKEITQEKLKELGKTMKVEFPQDTRVSGFFEERGGMDTATYLKVEIKPEDLGGFISKSPFSSSELSTDKRSVSDLKDVKWWRPESVRTFQSGQVRLPEAKVLNILVDRDREDKITVFLMWFST